MFPTTQLFTVEKMSNLDVDIYTVYILKEKNQTAYKILNQNKLSYVHLNVINTHTHTYKQIHMYKLFRSYTKDKNMTL